MRLIPTILALAVLGSATSVEACRFNRPPHDRVRGSFDAVVLGRVIRSNFVDGDLYEGRGWSATVTVTASVENRADAASYEIGRTGDSAACDDGQGIARLNETWVLYLWRNPTTGQMLVSQSYPLTVARRIDRRFRR